MRVDLGEREMPEREADLESPLDPFDALGTPAASTGTRSRRTRGSPGRNRGHGRPPRRGARSSSRAQPAFLDALISCVLCSLVTGAVIFDLDGVLVDSETEWDAARRELVQRSGGSWRPEATRAMQGMSSVEWSRYLRDELGVPMTSEEISASVVAALERRYRERLPLIPGALEAVDRLAARWPLGLASSANRPIIDLVLRESGLDRLDRGDGLLRRGAARQARPRRLSRGRAPARRRPGALRRGRGLVERTARCCGGGHARDRDPEPGVPAGGRRARAGRRDPSVDRRARRRDRRRPQRRTGDRRTSSPS